MMLRHWTRLIPPDNIFNKHGTVYSVIVLTNNMHARGECCVKVLKDFLLMNAVFV